ncbi:MAG: T9SS type A sorting domain-containing protein [Flavobacteriales bacterium]|nr:T9SS type A sorting domain-containing protein [Flavobacteriales bacterium]
MARSTLTLLTVLAHVTATSQLINGGFENGVSDWNQPCGCAPFQLSNDVPPGGGSWSFAAGIVDLNCVCTVTDAVHQPVTWLLPGQWVLTAWIKSADPGNIPGATVRISEGPAFSSNVLADAWSPAGAWTMVVDTFVVGPFTDLSSLQLSLIPDDGNAMPPGLFAYFDRIMIEPVLGTGVDDRRIEEIALYPNPAGSSVSIVEDGPVSGILIADALGRSHRVDDVSRNGDIITLDVSGLSPGAWWLKVITPKGVRIEQFIIQ